MVMEARHVKSIPFGSDAKSPATTQPWTRIDIDLYEIATDGAVVGYVEVVGSVFVALAGSRYDRAVEARQTLTFHEAVDALIGSAGRASAA